MRADQQLNGLKGTYKATPRQRLISGVIFISVTAFFGVFLLASYDKITLWPFPCGFKQLYGLPCPTCGMTASVTAFVQGKILESFYIQPAAALLCCILLVLAFLTFLMAFFGVYFSFLRRFFDEIRVRHLVLALIIIVAAGWAVTLARVLAADK